MSRVSIVIPVYNVEGYLDECLDSVEAQTTDDWEAVCVNDGSTDGSPGMLRRRAGADGRIRVVDKANGGLSSARNAGIEAARGDIVCFLDADDRLAPHACARIAEVMGASGAEVLTFGADTIPPDLADPWLDSVLNPRDVTYRDFTCDILFREESRPYAWRTALTSDFLRRTGVRFDESVPYGEDQVFDFAIYPRSRLTRLIPDHLYQYRVARKGSLMDGMSKDPSSMLASHVQIMARVFEDWDLLGILEAHTTDMLAWAVEFVLFDALFLPAGEARRVGDLMVDELLRHWTRDQVEGARLRPSVARIMDNALAGSPRTGRSARSLAASYRLDRHLRRALAPGLRGGGGTRS